MSNSRKCIRRKVLIDVVRRCGEAAFKSPRRTLCNHFRPRISEKKVHTYSRGRSKSLSEYKMRACLKDNACQCYAKNNWNPSFSSNNAPNAEPILMKAC